MADSAPNPNETSPTPAAAGGAPSGGASTAAVEASPSGRGRSHFVSKYGLLVAFFLTIVIFCALRPESFATVRNLDSILTLAAAPMILALGLTVVLVMQDFDLSFGAMIGLSTGIITACTVTFGWPWQLSILALVGAIFVVGILNGFMVAYLGGSSFIITLAMGTILTGVEFALTKQNTVFGGFPDSFTWIATGSILGISNLIWAAVLVAVVIWLLLDRTEIGRYMYAIGGNPEAARLSGVRVRQLRVLGFIIVAATAGIVGLLLTAQDAGYSPSAGVAYLLPAFAAAFLGAAVFRPGEFNVPGTIVGVLFLGVIQTGLIMLDFETYVINLVQGGILIAAVLISRIGQQSQ